jgi:hypothetical protein
MSNQAQLCLPDDLAKLVDLSLTYRPALNDRLYPPGWGTGWH